MKISKLLNKRYLSILIIFYLLGLNTFAEDQPVDIWNIDKEKLEESSKKKDITKKDENQVNETTIYNLQPENDISIVEVDSSLNSKKIKIIGLYDPEDFGLRMDMWSNSNGDQLKNIFSNLAKLDLSDDAAEIMNISLLTNSFFPTKNITKDEFLNIKSDWLIKNNDLDLIEEYLTKNQIISLHPDLTKFLIDQHLSNSNILKACKIFSENKEPINDEYLSKFNIFCLVNEGKIEEAQLIFDLKLELGFNDKYFEKKLNQLFGLTNKIDKTISEKNILDFHLAHRTNPEFKFNPDEKTNKLIWKYLASSNLLYNVNEIDVAQHEKIKIIEKATHDKNYPEQDLFEIYKRFQFNINQFLNAKEAHKTLTNIEAKALIYQRVLLESDIEKKIELIKILKDLFIKENLSDAFDSQLKKILEEINSEDIPSNYTTFYYTYLDDNENLKKKIKYNNDILHQSKLINYFNGDYAKSKIEKDINNFLKKIKKNKKYLISKKDIMLVESLKSDGIKISKKYENLYEINDSEIPSDIQVMINNNETGAAILRIAEIIGQDTIDSLDEDTLYFVISTFNQLNIDYLRNKILLKVLPLKV